MSGSENDDLESAKILIQENLLDEAKRILFRLIARIQKTDSHAYRRAREMLARIESIEMKALLSISPQQKKPPAFDDQTRVIQGLEKDLEIELNESSDSTLSKEWWSPAAGPLTAQDLFDLAVGFHEMGCHADAIRELRKAEKKIRIEQSFLGELGVSIVALHAQSLVDLGRAFEAKINLEPVLLEPDVPHEQKILLYYMMGLAEQALENKTTAKAWFQKVRDSEPGFRDVDQRLKALGRIS
jgi:hypothetical protein